jgi:hypothetical protein
MWNNPSFTLLPPTCCVRSKRAKKSKKIWLCRWSHYQNSSIVSQRRITFQTDGRKRMHVSLDDGSVLKLISLSERYDCRTWWCTEVKSEGTSSCSSIPASLASGRWLNGDRCVANSTHSFFTTLSLFFEILTHPNRIKTLGFSQAMDTFKTVYKKNTRDLGIEREPCGLITTLSPSLLTVPLWIPPYHPKELVLSGQPIP